MADRMQVDGERAASTSNGDGDDGSTIDESLYSRQLCVSPGSVRWWILMAN